jgi:hypothetical protein
MSDTAWRNPEQLLLTLHSLTDDELVARVKGLAARERRTTALLVAHLADLDTRDVYLRAGYSSLFAYCRGVLALSDGEAYNRIEVARTARRFPVVVELLASGEISLTGIRLLAPHLTPENHRHVLESARQKRKAAVEEIVAGLSPRPDVPATVRKLAQPKSAVLSPTSGAAGAGRAAANPPAAAREAMARTTPSSSGQPVPRGTDADTRDADTRATSTPVVLAKPKASADIRPLSPDRYRYQLTIGGATLEKLRLAKDMLRHAVPSGDDEAILDRALTVPLAGLARKKFGADPKATGRRAGAPGEAGGQSAALEAAGSRHVAVEIKRAVWLRDLGRCAFVGTNGHRCEERAFLEFHHVRPYAVGGQATVDNLALRCQRHNRYEAELHPIGA